MLQEAQNLGGSKILCDGWRLIHNAGHLAAIAVPIELCSYLREVLEDVTVRTAAVIFGDLAVLGAYLPGSYFTFALPWMVTVFSDLFEQTQCFRDSRVMRQLLYLLNYVVFTSSIGGRYSESRCSYLWRPGGIVRLSS
jgi:hypothetical protein